jgi:hypothetical protein
LYFLVINYIITASILFIINNLNMKKLTTLFLIFMTLGLAFIASAQVILGPSTSGTNPSTTASSESIFTRNLSVGSYGKDVMALKKILGLELGTTVNTSPTFTSTTASDVKKLQEKYAVEILIPNSLSAGTGFVGVSTRTKLNQLAIKYYINLSDFTLPASASTASTASATKVFFLTTLKLGSTGGEVTLLKIILNSDTSTALIPKNSTNVFDLATQDAVNKFQEKYASEILAPSGLTQGVGQVGPSTRKKLNSIINAILASAQSANASTTNGLSTEILRTISNNTEFQTYSPSNTTGISPTVSKYKPYGTLISSSDCEGVDLVNTYADGSGGTYYAVTKKFASECTNSLGFLSDINMSKTVFVTGQYDSRPQITQFATGFESSLNKTKVDIGPIDASGNAVITIFTPPINLFRVIDGKRYSYRDGNSMKCTSGNYNSWFDGGEWPFLNVTGVMLGNCSHGVNALTYDFPWQFTNNFDMKITPTLKLSPSGAILSSSSTPDDVSFAVKNSDFKIQNGDTYLSTPVIEDTYTITANGASTRYKIVTTPINCNEMYMLGIPVKGTITEVKKGKWNGFTIWKGGDNGTIDRHGYEPYGSFTGPYNSVGPTVYYVEGGQIQKAPYTATTIDNRTVDIDSIYRYYCPQPPEPRGYLFKTAPKQGSTFIGRAGPDANQVDNGCGGFFSGCESHWDYKYQRIWSTGTSGLAI